MKRSTKFNRVSWASGVNLCQVKPFFIDDCPSKIGTRADLEKKTLPLLQHSHVTELIDMPPGFEGSQYLNPLKEKKLHIPRIEWRCPPKYITSYGWRVAAGEGSQEVETQKLREMTVLEALYPRFSAIPPCPSISLDIEHEHYDDSLTPNIPLTPIEEKEGADKPSDLVQPNSPISSQSPALPQDFVSSGALNSLKCYTPAQESPANEKTAPCLGSDLVTAAASAAFTALMKSKEQGSLIDTDLLVKIFNDPKMIEKLINNHQPPASMRSPMLTSTPVTSSDPSPCLPPALKPLALPANGNLHHLPGEMQPLLKPVTRQTPSPCPKTSMLVAPVQPKVTGSDGQYGAVSVSGIERIAPSISVPSPESINAPTSRPAIMQPLSSALPSQPNISVPQSSMATKPGPVPNRVSRPLDMMVIQPNSVPQIPTAALTTNSLKDFNYIKNLIREHGTDKPETQDRNRSQIGTYHNHVQNLELGQNIKLREMNPKFQKPCIYFRRSSGCKKGSNCPYQHDLSFQLQTGSTLEAPMAKRIKLSGEIKGRT